MIVESYTGYQVRQDALRDAEQAQQSTYNCHMMRELTDEEKLNGTYLHGVIDLSAFDLPKVMVENPKGSIRRAINNEWVCYQPAHYGYFNGTLSADGDPVDVYVGPKPDVDTVYVVNMYNRDNSFDEHKVLIGFETVEEATKCIIDAFDVDYEIPRENVRVATKAVFRDWINRRTQFDPFIYGMTLNAYLISQS